MSATVAHGDGHISCCRDVITCGRRLSECQFFVAVIAPLYVGVAAKVRHRVGAVAVSNSLLAGHLGGDRRYAVVSTRISEFLDYVGATVGDGVDHRLLPSAVVGYSAIFFCRGHADGLVAGCGEQVSDLVVARERRDGSVATFDARIVGRPSGCECRLCRFVNAVGVYQIVTVICAVRVSIDILNIPLAVIVSILCRIIVLGRDGRWTQYLTQCVIYDRQKVCRNDSLADASNNMRLRLRDGEVRDLNLDGLRAGLALVTLRISYRV